MKGPWMFVTALVLGLWGLGVGIGSVQAALPYINIDDGTTEDKAQSKLWYQGGSWWGILPVEVAPDNTDIYFFRMVDGAFVQQSFPGALVSTSESDRVDVLQDGTDLFVLIYTKGTGAKYVHRYSFNASDNTYSLVQASEPIYFNSSVITATIAKDTASPSRLWIAYDGGTQVWVTSAEPPYFDWPDPANHVQLYSGIGPNDIVAMAAFDTNKIGVMWTIHGTTGPDEGKLGFRYHIDGALEGTWSTTEFLNSGSEKADGHLHLTTNMAGDLLAANKDTNGNRVFVRVRKAVDDSWDGPYLVSTTATRATVLFEESKDEVYVIYRDMVSPTTIKYKRKPPNALNEMSSDPAVEALRVTGTSLTDVTSTKQWVDLQAGGIVVAAREASGSARKAYYQPPITHEEVQTGESSSAASVATSDPLTAKNDHLYLAAISTTPPVPITSVMGLGLSWVEVDTQCGARNQTQVSVWRAQGTTTGGEVVTANFNGTPDNAVLAVSRYSGVHIAAPSNPIGTVIAGNKLGLNGACNDNTADTSSYSRTYAGVENRKNKGIESPWGGTTLCLSHSGYTSWRCGILPGFRPVPPSQKSWQMLLTTV